MPRGASALNAGPRLRSKACEVGTLGNKLIIRVMEILMNLMITEMININRRMRTGRMTIAMRTMKITIRA